MHKLLLGATLVLAAAAPAAHAATPASGDVSETHLVQTWSGEADSQPMNNTPQTETHQLCVQPFCDTFTLDVKDKGTALKVHVDAPSSAGFVDLLVTKPDGTSELLGGNADDTFHEVTYDGADLTTGTYTFDIWTNEFAGPLGGQYTAQAELCSATVQRADCFPPPPEDGGGE